MNSSRNSYKKSQISGQVFIYILAAMLFVLILIWGVKAISDLKVKSEQAALIDLKTELSSAIKSVRSTADVKKRTLVLPSNFDKICFIDLNAYAEQNAGIKQESTMIYDSWKDRVRQNVFLLPRGDFEMYIDKLEVNEPGGKRWLCINAVNGQVSLRLEGKGDRTKVSKWGTN